MNFHTKSRNQKLFETIYPFFGEMAETHGDSYPLRVCRHLRKLEERAIFDPRIKPFLVALDRDYPEEEALESSELQFLLKCFDQNISEQLRQQQKKWVHTNNHKARFRVINGGMSANPDIPYVDMSQVVHDYGLDD